MNIFWRLIASSANPQEVSTTVIGLLLSLAPILMLVFGLAEADVKELVTAIGNVVFLILSIISAVMTVVGLLRKIKMGRWSAQQ